MNIFLNEAGQNKLPPKQILTDPVLFLAFGFGSGLARKAPGTFGTLAGVPVYLLFAQADLWLYSLLVLAALLLGVWLCGVAADKLGEHDFGGIVWDEIVGLLITLWGVALTWQNICLGFVLFRFFDIIKPWPIKWVDNKVHGGLGIMLDDVLAGIFAAVVLSFVGNGGWWNP